MDHLMGEKMSRQAKAKQTQGDYRILQDIKSTKRRLKENMTEAEYRVLEKYEVEMVTEALAVLLQEEKDDKIGQLENSVEKLTSMMKPILALLNSTEPVGLPMRFFPKKVQQQLEEQLNHR